MQQRQPRLGDILDDYCPRERRVTNHVVVAMVGEDVKQTRCTTCDADHEYKHAKVPRQRRKTETPAALYAQVLAGGPKRIAHEQRAATSSPRRGAAGRGGRRGPPRATSRAVRRRRRRGRVDTVATSPRRLEQPRTGRTSKTNDDNAGNRDDEEARCIVG